MPFCWTGTVYVTLTLTLTSTVVWSLSGQLHTNQVPQLCLYIKTFIPHSIDHFLSSSYLTHVSLWCSYSCYSVFFYFCSFSFLQFTLSVLYFFLDWCQYKTKQQLKIFESMSSLFASELNLWNFHPFHITWVLPPSTHLFPLSSSALELPGLPSPPPHLYLISLLAVHILSQAIPTHCLSVCCSFCVFYLLLRSHFGFLHLNPYLYPPVWHCT